MALDKRTIDLPLAAGLDTKTESRALQPPGLAVCKNAQFDEVGAMQTRKPYAEITDHAGNTITDIRKLAVYGDELVAFSKDKLWSYASGDGLWTQRAEHLAVKVDETARFVTTGDQYDCDRAELDGVTMYCWSEDTPSGTTAYVAAIDTTTGSVKLSPTAVKSGASHCKLVATTNKIMLCFITTNTIWERTYDPADLSSAETSQAVSGVSTFDAVVDGTDPTKVWIALVRTSNYSVLQISETPAQVQANSRATTVSGPIAIAYDATNDEVAIAYNNGTAVKADFYTSAVVSITNDVAIGTASSATVNQIAACYQTISDDCVFFWSAGETLDETGFQVETNVSDSAGTTGTESDLVIRCGVASRAFTHDGNVYVWVAFAAAAQGTFVTQLQNNYFLYREDGLLVAKSIVIQAGGFSTSTGYLPTVQDLGSNRFSWCGQYRRIIPLGGERKGYSAKSPQDVGLEFDSDEVRRTSQLGETLYVAGMLSQYDGVNLAEVGFHYFPFYLGFTPTAGTLLSAGSYNWKQTFSWYNARNELERSTTTTIHTDGPWAGPNLKAQIQGVTLNVTNKTGVAAEFWRQVVDAAEYAPFFLITSKDPASTGDNDYVENDPTAYFLTSVNDHLADTELVKKEPNPENGGLTLENLPPPIASVMLATQDRLLLAGIPANPYRVVYSKLRGQGEIAAFHDALSIDLPPDGGPITALGFLNETLIVFKEKAVFALSGDGFDNNGGGQNYGPARILSSDVGATTADSLALTPRGIVFKSSKGWQLLNRGWAVNYIGGPVSEFDSDTALSVHVMEAQHQVRILTDARCLVWDYLVNQWAEWTLNTGLSAVVYNDKYHYTDGTKIYKEQDDWSVWNGPQSTFVSLSTFTVTLADDVSSWVDPGTIVVARGTASELAQSYYSPSGVTVTTDDVITPTPSVGASVESTAGTILDGAASANDTSITVNSTTGFATTGYLNIGIGTANEEEVSYTGKTATTFTGLLLANSHLDNDDVLLVHPEPQGLDLETGWIKLGGLEGFQRVYELVLLGEYKGAHDLRIRIAYDYDEAWVDDKTWTVSPTTIGGPLQLKHGPARPKCAAMKVRITAQAEGVTTGPTTEALQLTGITLNVGVKRGTNKHLPAAQKQ